jgi:O-antigen biosynthesis protein WbqP
MHLQPINKDCGIPGWAQINGRDDLPIPIKVGYDEYYLNHRSFFFDLKTRLP